MANPIPERIFTAIQALVEEKYTGRLSLDMHEGRIKALVYPREVKG